MYLSSPAFDDDDSIPEQYGYEKENVNPPLTIGDVPADAVSLALVMDDPDAQESAGKVWDHWILWNIDPNTTEIEERPTLPNVREGRNDYGETGYGGPNPSNQEHTYHFRLYALDTEIDLDAGASKDELREAMVNHIINESELRGRYAPN